MKGNNIIDFLPLIVVFNLYKSMEMFFKSVRKK